MTLHQCIKKLSFKPKLLISSLLILVISTVNAQLNNFGNFHIFPGANIKLNTSFTNKSGAFYQNDGTFFITGNFTNNQPGMVPGVGVTEFKSDIIQNINGSRPSFFNHLIINNSSGQTNLSTNINVNTVLTFVSGLIKTGNSSVIIFTDARVSGAGQNTGWVDGNLQKDFIRGSNISKTFEIGDDSTYTPASVKFSNINSAGSLTARVTGTDDPDIASSGIKPDKSVNRYWTFTNNSIAFDNAIATLNWNSADVDAGALTANFKVGEYTNSAWILPSTTSALPTSIQATGITSFGDFIVGESTCNGIHPNQPGSVAGQHRDLCYGGIYTYSINPVQGATSYTWNVPPGIPILNNTGTSITLNVPAGIVHERLSVVANNTCGLSVPRNFGLWGRPSKPRIVGTSAVTANQTDLTYRVPNPQPRTTYTWTVPNSATLVSGQGTSRIVVNWGAASDSISVSASNDCNYTRQIFYSVSVTSGFAGNSENNAKVTENNKMISVYPNPTQGKAKLLFTMNKEIKYIVAITDMTGKVLQHKESTSFAGENQVDLDISNYANGMYMISLITNEEKRNIKLIKEK